MFFWQAEAITLRDTEYSHHGLEAFVPAVVWRWCWFIHIQSWVLSWRRFLSPIPMASQRWLGCHMVKLCTRDTQTAWTVCLWVSGWLGDRWSQQECEGRTISRALPSEPSVNGAHPDRLAPDPSFTPWSESQAAAFEFSSAGSHELGGKNLKRSAVSPSF